MRYHAFSPVARFIKIDVQYVIIMIKGSWSTMKLKLKNIYILGVDIRFKKTERRSWKCHGARTQVHFFYPELETL